MSPARPRPKADTLEVALARIFAREGETRASWFAVTGGEQLFAAGDEPDTLYFLRSGRLGVFRQEEGQVEPQFMGVIRPGEPVGEMAMLAGTPHSSTVVALRDSEILALPATAFFEAARTEPDLMVELSRLMIRRARDKTSGAGEPTVFGFISARPRPVRAFVERVAAGIEHLGFTVQVIDHSALSSAAEWFSRVEDTHDYVLYVAEQDEPAWGALCARQVDRLFVVGDSLSVPPPSPSPRRNGTWRQLTDLILLRPPSMAAPANTRIWLDALDPSRWFQVREGDEGDAARIARVVTGVAVGLVLSGGGARAYAHIGAVEVLRAAGVPFDFVGGASMGAVVGAGVALGWDDAEMDRRIRKAFVESSPLSDIAFPLVAMTRAGKVARLIEEAYGDVDMADLTLPFFCISSNLTQGAVTVHRRGPLKRAIRASISLPGVMPPVVENGEVLVDGAVLNNFPTAIMRQMNPGPIVGVDLSRARGVDAATLERPPSWWKWLLSGDWKKGTPIVSILMRAATITTDAELEHARAASDLLIVPTPDGVDIRDWKAYEPAVATGRAAATAALASQNRSIVDLALERRRKPDPVPETEPTPPAAPKRKRGLARLRG